MERAWAMPTARWPDKYFLRGNCIPDSLAFQRPDGSTPTHDEIRLELRLPANQRRVKTRLFSEAELKEIVDFQVIIIR